MSYPQQNPEVLDDVLREVRVAMTKFPNWPRDPLHAVGVVNEEVGELSKAVLQQVYEPHKQSRDAVYKEAVQACAMLLRFLAGYEMYNFQSGQSLQYRQQSLDIINPDQYRLTQPVPTFKPE